MELPAAFPRYILPALAGLVLALVWPGGGNRAEAPTAESNSSPGAQKATAGNADSLKARSVSRPTSGVSGEYAKAWQQLLRESDDSEEVWKRRYALLQDWADHDLRAAVGAALDFGKTNPRSAYSSPFAHLLTAFDDIICRQPSAFFGLLKGDPFGLNSGFARNHALQTLARQDPGFIPSILDQLGPKDRTTALTLCLESPKLDGAQKDELIRSLGNLPDSSANRSLLAMAGARLASLDKAELLSRYSAAQGDGERRILTSALQSKLITPQAPREEIAKHLESLPTELSSAILDQTLDSPKGNASAFTLALDRVLGQPTWAGREKELCMRLHQLQLQSGSRNATEAAQWATEIPEREDCEDLYRVAMRSLIYSNPDSAWQTVEAMPAGWKRDNAYLEMVNRAANTQSDEAAARRALEQIESEHFRAQAATMIERAKANKAKQ